MIVSLHETNFFLSAVDDKDSAIPPAVSRVSTLHLREYGVRINNIQYFMIEMLELALVYPIHLSGNEICQKIGIRFVHPARSIRELAIHFEQ